MLELTRHLIHQVKKAIPAGRSEQDVLTYITRPMWEALCEELYEPIDSVPGEWGKSMRVYGSETRIIESDQFYSFSQSKL